jgi:hypothetical protein
MRWRHVVTVSVVVIGIMVQVGCSNAGKPASGDSEKQGQESLKAAMPPGMEAPTEGGDTKSMYQGGSGPGGQAMDPSKMYKQGGYPSGAGGQGGQGGQPQPTTPGK